jgi:hypothetical protein
MINRLNIYPLDKRERNGEKDTIKHILQQNQYQLSNLIKLALNKGKHEYMGTTKKKEQRSKHTKDRWTTFTYFGHEVRKITNIFRNTNLKVAYRTTNNIQRHVQPKQRGNNIYEHSGIYELRCKDCPLEYVGQTEDRLALGIRNI